MFTTYVYSMIYTRVDCVALKFFLFSGAKFEVDLPTPPSLTKSALCKFFNIIPLGLLNWGVP